MIHEADVVVIGSGGLGAATSFYLTTRGVRRVALVDRHDIGSQTSPRAAGLVSYVRKSDLMIQLIKRAGQILKDFTRETGEPLRWMQSGSLKVARRPQDVVVLHSDMARARRHGLDVDEISAEDAHRQHPFLETAGVLAVIRVGDDMYFDPPQVAIGFARAAEASGAILLPHTTVTDISIDAGHVIGVETSNGTIRSAIVVDAAGAWTRQVAEASGIRIPLVPTRHQLFVTRPVDGARTDLPIVRIMDAAVYMRPCDGGFLWGVFEEEPRFFDMSIFGEGFHIKETPLDADVLWRAADDVKRQLPILSDAKIQEHRGGIPTMTADGEHILGPAPGVPGFFFASGCNVAGLSISPALGEALAAWIAVGRPPMDLTPISPSRFDTAAWSEEQLQRDAAWQYRHFYGTVE